MLVFTYMTFVWNMTQLLVVDMCISSYSSYAKIFTTYNETKEYLTENLELPYKLLDIVFPMIQDKCITSGSISTICEETWEELYADNIRPLYGDVYSVSYCHYINEHCQYVFADGTREFNTSIFFFGTLMGCSLMLFLHTILGETECELHKRKDLEARQKLAGEKWEVSWNKRECVFTYISNPGYEASGEPRVSVIKSFTITEYPTVEWLMEPDNKKHPREETFMGGTQYNLRKRQKTQ